MLPSSSFFDNWWIDKVWSVLSLKHDHFGKDLEILSQAFPIFRGYHLRKANDLVMNLSLEF
jgi:hypothetical protein